MAYLPNQKRPFRIGPTQARPTQTSRSQVERRAAQTSLRQQQTRRHHRPTLGVGLLKLTRQFLGLPVPPLNLPSADHDLPSSFTKGNAKSNTQGSRLQRRLQNRPQRDRRFLKLVRRERSRLKQLRTILNRHRF